MLWWQILLLTAVALVIILLFLRSIKICEGGKIMQGCGKLLFPWSKKVKIKGFDTYCCEDCFKRDLELFSSKGSTKRNLSFTEREELDGIDTSSDDE